MALNGDSARKSTRLEASLPSMDKPTYIHQGNNL
jgi:hypothetical protein